MKSEGIVVAQLQTEKGTRSGESGDVASVLSEVCERIASNRSLDGTLKIIGSAISKTLGLSPVAFIVKETPKGASDHKPVLVGADRGGFARLFEDLKPESLRHKKPIPLKGLGLEAIPLANDSEPTSDGGCLLLPIVSGRRVWGWLAVVRREDRLLDSLERIDPHLQLAALAISSSKAMAALDRLTKKDRFAERLRLVGEATRLVVDDPDLTSAFRRVAAVMSRLFRIKDGAVFATDPRSTLLQAVAVWGAVNSSPEALEACERIAVSSIGENPQIRVFRDRHDLQAVMEELTVARGLIGSAIVIPISYQGEVLGVITAASKSPRRVHQEEIALLDVFASQLGIAVQNVRVNTKLIEAEMALEKATSQAIIEATGDGIFIVDAHKTIQAFNGAMEKITGYSSERVIAKKKCSDVIRCASKGRVLCEKRCPFTHVPEEGEQFQVSDASIAYRANKRGSDERRVSVELIHSSIIDAEGTRRGLCVVRDVSDIKITQDEMRIAREIQSSLLPEKPPVIEGHDIAFICNPAMQVGGDCIDFIPLHGGRIGIAISDIAGKSLPAALFVSMQKGLMRSSAARTVSVDRPLEKLNERILADTSPEVFITMIYGIYDPIHGIFTYVNAGHIPPILYRNGKCRMLETPQPPLGVNPRFKGEKRVVRLMKDDILVLISDGTIDARDDEGNFFGLPRLRRIIERHPKMSASELANHIYRKVREFAGNRLQDDFTLILLKCEKEIEARRISRLKVENRPASILEMRRFVMEWARRLPFDKEELTHIEIAVGEAVTNAIQHGRSADRAKNFVIVECEMGDDHLRVRVMDNGPGFTPNLSMWKVPPAGSSHGRGIFLMKVLMDELTYENVPSGCCLSMVKRVRHKRNN